MPHNNHSNHGGHTGGSGDDLGSTDEVKIFKDEGDGDEEKTSENLLEEKSSLIDLTESEEKSGKHSSRQDHSPVFGKTEPSGHTSSFNMGYLVSPYSYPNGAAGGLPVSMANKMTIPSFFCNGDHLTTPPPAHCGIPPYQLDPKAIGLTRPTIYPFPTSQYPYPMLSPDMSQVASWHTPSVYSATSGFRSPYPSSLPINTSLSSEFYRFSPSLLPSVHTHHHVLNSHPAIVTPGPKQEIASETNHRFGRTSHDQKVSPGVIQSESKESNEKKKPHIKKPLNAFMLYMKEMRAKVVAECTLKESAAINQILGRRWHALGREEQAKYYELARRERQLHMQLYPDWSSRANTTRGKKRKRKQDSNDGGNNMKKCRARYGLDQQNQWCKPCRRKKKCIRYMESEGEDGNDLENNIISDDNLGSCGSIDDSQTPDDDNESINQSLSSPGGMSALSSLQSPSTSLASPLNLLTSPAPPNLENNNSGLTSPFNSGKSSSSKSNSNNKNCNKSNYKSNNNNNSSNNNNTNNSTDSNITNNKPTTATNINNSNNNNRQNSHAANNSNNSKHDKKQISSSCNNGISLVGGGNTGNSDSRSNNNDLSSTINDRLLFDGKSIKIEIDYKMNYNSKCISNYLMPTSSSITPPNHNHDINNFYEKIVRNPVGANPRDVNNPLSVNQLTKRDFNSVALLLSPASSSSSPLLQHTSGPGSGSGISSSNLQFFQNPRSQFNHHHQQFSQHQQIQQLHNLHLNHHQIHQFGSDGGNTHHTQNYPNIVDVVNQTVQQSKGNPLIQGPGQQGNLPHHRNSGGSSDEGGNGAISVT
uniref:dTCF n=1 Tax=Nephrotoma suturalis TaxID=2545982 RepID=A0A5P8HXT6_9DIPT|nr:pangolin [Nephrotoma suturalis]